MNPVFNEARFESVYARRDFAATLREFLVTQGHITPLESRKWQIMGNEVEAEICDPALETVSRQLYDLRKERIGLLREMIRQEMRNRRNEAKGCRIRKSIALNKKGAAQPSPVSTPAQVRG